MLLRVEYLWRELLKSLDPSLMIPSRIKGWFWSGLGGG